MQASRPPRDSGHASTSARQHAVSYRGSRRHLHRLPRRSEIDISALVDAPELAEDLQAFQGKLGAEFDGRGIAVRYGEESEWKAREAWQHGVVLADRSHWGRLRFGGEGHLGFLHSQSTQDFNSRQPGTGAQTVFATPTARTIDVATVLVQGRGALAIVSPETREVLLQRLQKHIFPMDEVTITDVTAHTRMFTLLGPAAKEVVADWGGDAVAGLPRLAHAVMNFEGAPVVVVRDSGLGPAVDGWTFIVDEPSAADFWRKAALKGALPMGTEAWEEVRVLNGVPAAGVELTDAFNPLEAGLYHAVSLAKGCYVGQETIAKVHNNNGVKQQLWGLRLREGATCSPGSVIADSNAADAKRLGAVTSAVTAKAGPFALGYVRCKRGGEQAALEGEQVFIDGEPAKIVAVPALTREFSPEALPERKDSAGAGGPVAEDEKAAKLKAMQERMEQWKKQAAS